MYLLYLDESGNPKEQSEHFVVAGAAIHETTTHYLRQRLDSLQHAFVPEIVREVEYHSQHIMSGRNEWRRVPKLARIQLLDAIGEEILKVKRGKIILFAAIIDKDRDTYGKDAVHRAVEEVCGRFDIFLTRPYHQKREPQRGFILFDQGNYDELVRALVGEFRDTGTKWSKIRNLSDVPFFGPSHATRMLQLADYIAYATFQMYQRGNPMLFARLVELFDHQAGQLHGLVHITRTYSSCLCPACSSRRTPHDYGPWLVPPPADPAS